MNDPTSGEKINTGCFPYAWVLIGMFLLFMLIVAVGDGIKPTMYGDDDQPRQETKQLPVYVVRYRLVSVMGTVPTDHFQVKGGLVIFRNKNDNTTYRVPLTSVISIEGGKLPEEEQ